MTTVDKLIEERKLPTLLKMKSGKTVKNAVDFEKRREEIKKILAEEEYGYIPEKPDHLDVELTCQKSFCAGKATHKLLKFTVTMGENKFFFPVQSVIPTAKGPHPAFIHIDFNPGVPTRYTPSEEICDGGFAVFSFCYKDVTSDDGNFKNGIAKYFGGRRKASSPGKIAMWAWAAMRVMDYVQTLAEIDRDNIAVCGHSRLGKTALVTGAYDNRFKFVISNDSGCSGASLARKNTGESVQVITNVFPFWFCPRYVKSASSFTEVSKFDQHFLLSLVAPRHLLIGSAKDDAWADPTNEFLSAVAASEAYGILGERGLIHNGELPTAKTVLGEGKVCYHIRNGAHYFSREDWQVYMEYIRKNLV